MRGVRNDYFSLADTNVLVQSASSSPESQTAKAYDSLGDVACEENYGGMTPVENVYKVCRGGSFDTSVKLGSVKGNYVIDRIVAARSNQDALTVTVHGLPKSIVGDTASIPTYTISWPTDYLAGGMQAKAAGIAVTKGRVISSSITAAMENVVVSDSAGTQACVNFHAGRMEATNEVQACDTAPAATIDTAWVEAAGSGAIQESNTDYEVATFGAYKNLTRDT